MPNTTIPRPTATVTPVMKPRTIRCDDPLWDDATAIIAAEGLDISKVVRHYLRYHVDSASPELRERVQQARQAAE